MNRIKPKKMIDKSKVHALIKETQNKLKMGDWNYKTINVLEDLNLKIKAL